MQEKITLGHKKRKDLCLRFWIFSLKILRDLLFIALTSSIFDVEKFSYFLKQVRILPEIDWYRYQDANNAAPTGAVRHWINTYPF